MLESPLPYPNHGNTVASWVMVSIMLVGIIIAAVGFDSFHWPVVFVGATVTVLGIISGLVLKMMGFGQGGAKTKYKKH